MASKFFLYARKSSDSEERQVLSIEAQLSELRSLALKENISIVSEFTEAMTAKTPGRPIFNQMLDRIEDGQASGIIAWHPDRLARNSVDGGRIVFLLDTGKLSALKFPTFWFENTPQGKFMLNIAFGQSKYYVDNLSENVKRGLRQKLRRGEWPGFAPVGYTNDLTAHKIVVDPVKGPLVRRLFETYATGRYTLRHLKEESFQWGLVNRNGQPLVKAELQRTLTNPFFFGLMRYAGELHEATHQPLISKQLFDEVQRVLRARGRPHQSKKHLFPFLGLAECSNCGAAITAERQKGHHYYRCTRKKAPCQEPYVREEALAQQIKAAIDAVALPSEPHQKMLDELAKETETARQPVAQFTATAHEKLSDLSKKLDRLLDAQLDGLVERSEYLRKKASLLNQKVELDEKLAALETKATGWLERTKTFLAAAHEAEEIATTGDLESQKEFLKKIGSNFHVAAKTLRFSYKKPWEFFARAQKNQKIENWRRARDSNPRYGYPYT